MKPGIVHVGRGGHAACWCKTARTTHTHTSKYHDHPRSDDQPWKGMPILHIYDRHAASHQNHRDHRKILSAKTSLVCMCVFAMNLVGILEGSLQPYSLLYAPRCS